MKESFAKRLQWLAEQEWLHKSVRTFLVVAPGLSFFVATGDQRGVIKRSFDIALESKSRVALPS
jgi:hypothetical protein